MGSSTTGGKEDDGNSEDASDGGLFSEGEKVLAYHGPLIYEAKVQRVEVRKKEWKYFVHYLGWSKNWDEWVGSDRLMKYSEANVEKQKQLFEDQNSDKNLKGRIAQSKPKTTAVTRGKKRKADSGVEDRDADEPEQVMKIPLPGTLKKQLVDDWEFVSQLGKLIKLPRHPTVDDILKKYLEFKTKQDGVVGDALVEILNGLRTYFDKSLPAMLLYKPERAQFLEHVPENSTIAPSSVYGAEHLLRLFVKLPELLVYTNMEDDALSQLQQKLADFLKYLQKNQSVFFLSTYDGPKVDIGVDEAKELHS
ncbi:hypothetical protein GOP47_0025772 [Adiantum capillus-veneris]|uniref:Chromo domain-containing protein n=1 Tax=Adiantum capillus-veneris TaxID=13818 RepID=A0A9D4Z2G2_ADICA|nr:hypothetical protein GOP47_0025772 [Adiantum capillus-veneris]